MNPSHPLSRQNTGALPRPPYAFGPQPLERGVRFSLWCRDADAIDLLLFDDPEDLRPRHEIHLSPEEHRVGDLWSVFVPVARPGMSYVYRIERTGSKLPENQYVLDPYAPAVVGATQWGETLLRQPGAPLHTGPAFPKGLIVRDAFDWGDDRSPAVAWEDMIVYELHVRGFTRHPSSGVRHPGTYAGLMEKIPYLKDLGVTSVELMPIHEFDEMEYFHSADKREQLRNFWGYSTLSFFAPMSRYRAGSRPGSQVQEFKALVKALHAAGIEVILDVVFNHTAEGGSGGPVYNFKALDPDVYYIRDAVNGFHNYTGCGNTVNTNHPVVRRMILDCLVHWVTEYHVDGFRFDLASIFTRGRDGRILDNPPLIEEIDEHPLLRGVKMIAEAWDAAGAYQVGNFPSERWPTWNGKFRDDVRSFWRGDKGKLSIFGTRLLGSEDLYHAWKMGPLKSVNFVACHDGFTLADITRYEQKHNLDNLEENRDGENHNMSRNWGVEGDTADPQILALRLQTQKNLIATVLLAHGIPMLGAGDEFARTQKGSNNAYCQDNDISWVDWRFLERNAELHQFTRECIALRKRFPALRRRSMIGKGTPQEVADRLTWYAPDGGVPHWEAGAAIALRLSGRATATGADKDGEELLILFNASEGTVEFKMPETERFRWRMLLYTTDKRLHRSSLGTVFHAAAHSLVIFAARDLKHPPTT